MIKISTNFPNFRAFDTKEPRRLIYALQNTSNIVLKTKKRNVHPIFLIWSAFPLLLSEREDVKRALLELIHSVFTFAKDVLRYPSVLDVASSINQSDVLYKAMDHFYDALFDGFNDSSTNFECYFGLVLAASLVSALSSPTLRQSATVILNDALSTIGQPYYAIYFVILAVAFTDDSVDDIVANVVRNTGRTNETFQSLVCHDADHRTPYEAVWITKALFMGLTTREDRASLFSDALINFLRVRIEIPTKASTYILRVLTPIAESPDTPKENVNVLSKVIAVATTALPYGSNHDETKLCNPEPNKIPQEDLIYHFRAIVSGIVDCIQRAYRFDP